MTSSSQAPLGTETKQDAEANAYFVRVFKTRNDFLRQMGFGGMISVPPLQELRWAATQGDVVCAGAF